MELNEYMINEFIEINKIYPTNIISDGKKVYVKRLDAGYLPNNDTKNIPHGLINFKVFDIKGTAINPDGDGLVLPFAWVFITSQIGFYITNTNVVIATGQNRSSYYAYIDVYFTYNK